jgi:ABC-type polysaccharide/polyol phosphate transport system ATPase subunit
MILASEATRSRLEWSRERKRKEGEQQQHGKLLSSKMVDQQSERVIGFLGHQSAGKSSLKRFASGEGEYQYSNQFCLIPLLSIYI